MENPGLIWVVPIGGLIAIVFALYMARWVLRQDKGTKEMQAVGGMIVEGAGAFMRRQYTTIGILALVFAIIIGGLIGLFDHNLAEGARTALAFIVGAVCSAVSGFVGMYIAVRANLRCAAAAQKSLNQAIIVALRGGSVAGFLIVALSLLGVTAMYYLYGGDPGKTPFIIVGFGFGASFVALFAQLGGGIYTKAADMGADLVGKVEAGIPEDDPRNAAVIADLVGDNVGDCAGRGADLFESTAAENIGAMILGIAIYAVTKNPWWVLFPLVLRAFGIFASLIGILSVKAKENERPMKALNRGYFVAVGLSVVGMFLATQIFMLQNITFLWAGLIGIATSVATIFVTQYYTEPGYRPVNAIARASRTGPATNIVTGTAMGFECTFATALLIGIAMLTTYALGMSTHMPNGGVFATAVATMGMLMTCPFILAMDTFGPITDNANGIIEMAGGGDKARHITERLDAAGNTTKALTKGYAMISAGLAAFLLFQAYLDKVIERNPEAIPVTSVGGIDIPTVNIGRVEVFVAALLAGMLVYLFSSLAIRAVGNTAQAIIEEVRRQFRSDPGIMKGTSRPDYRQAVDITARAGLREMVLPGVLVVVMPIIVGVGFRLIPGYNAPMAVAAFLMVGTIGGILMATFMNMGGGAWDNAKKMIEDGQLKDAEGNPIKKGSPTHAAAVVGDTVGDPFKDTAGPSLHVLVKLLSTITLVFSPLFIASAIK